MSLQWTNMLEKALRLWMFLAAACPFDALAQEVQSEVIRQGEFIRVHASVELPAGRSTVWSVITDYGRMAQFIPDMDYSRVVSRGPDGLVVEQKGRYGMFLFTREVEMRLGVVESPPHSVVLRLISGNVRDMSGRYDLYENGTGTRLVYQGRFLPEEDLPPLIGIAMVRHTLEKHFVAMVREIARRDAQERAGAPPAP